MQERDLAVADAAPRLLVDQPQARAPAALERLGDVRAAVGGVVKARAALGRGTGRPACRRRAARSSSTCESPTPSRAASTPCSVDRLAVLERHPEALRVERRSPRRGPRPRRRRDPTASNMRGSLVGGFLQPLVRRAGSAAVAVRGGARRWAAGPEVGAPVVKRPSRGRPARRLVGLRRRRRSPPPRSAPRPPCGRATPCESRASAIRSSSARLSMISMRASNCASSTRPCCSSSRRCSVACEVDASLPDPLAAKKIWLPMPYSSIIARLISVTRLRSSAAPVVVRSNTICSATYPPSNIFRWSSSSGLDRR